MSFEDTVKGIANREFQNKTGTPPEMLRGLIGSANAELQNFAARRLAIPSQVDKPDTKVTSDITRLGGGTPPSLNEAASTVGAVGSGEALGPVTNVIQCDSGVLNYYTVNEEFDSAV